MAAVSLMSAGGGATRPPTSVRARVSQSFVRVVLHGVRLRHRSRQNVSPGKWSSTTSLAQIHSHARVARRSQQYGHARTQMRQKGLGDAAGGGTTGPAGGSSSPSNTVINDTANRQTQQMDVLTDRQTDRQTEHTDRLKRQTYKEEMIQRQNGHTD